LDLHKVTINVAAINKYGTVPNKGVCLEYNRISPAVSLEE